MLFWFSKTQPVFLAFPLMNRLIFHASENLHSQWNIFRPSISLPSYTSAIGSLCRANNFSSSCCNCQAIRMRCNMSVNRHLFHFLFLFRSGFFTKSSLFAFVTPVTSLQFSFWLLAWTHNLPLYVYIIIFPSRFISMYVYLKYFLSTLIIYLSIYLSIYLT